MNTERTTQMNEETSGLVADKICKEYPAPGQPLVVLKDVDLALKPGDATAITGPSGCGKSTLLHILGSLDTATTGSVRLDGIDPFALSAADLAAFRGENIGFVFQDHHLLPQCTVLENVLVPTLVAPDAATAGYEVHAREILERVGLTPRLDHRPAELSGGERQRAAIARALIRQPRVLLCDEPTGNLDPESAGVVSDLFLALSKEQSTTLIVVTHSLDFAGRFPHHLRLDDGALLPA